MTFGELQTGHFTCCVDGLATPPFEPAGKGWVGWSIWTFQWDWKNSLGRFAVRRKTIRKRMRAKLQRIKLEIRKRMHDPLSQSGQWLNSIVQGHFNYYGVPNNTLAYPCSGTSACALVA